MEDPLKCYVILKTGWTTYRREYQEDAPSGNWENDTANKGESLIIYCNFVITSIAR